MALEKEEEEERNKTIESLKTALRTQPMRSAHITVIINIITLWTQIILHIQSHLKYKLTWYMTIIEFQQWKKYIIFLKSKVSF